MSYHKTFDENTNGFLSRNSKLILIFIQNIQNLKGATTLLRLGRENFQFQTSRLMKNLPHLR